MKQKKLAVEQGDIIFLDVGPTRGHEEDGRRPALVVSISDFTKLTGLVKVVPITNSDNPFGLIVPMPGGCKTTGSILCQHERSLDINERHANYVEKCPKETVKKVLDILDMSIHE